MILAASQVQSLPSQSQSARRNFQPWRLVSHAGFCGTGTGNGKSQNIQFVACQQQPAIGEGFPNVFCFTGLGGSVSHLQDTKDVGYNMQAVLERLQYVRQRKEKAEVWRWIGPIPELGCRNSSKVWRSWVKIRILLELKVYNAHTFGNGKLPDFFSSCCKSSEFCFFKRRQRVCFCLKIEKAQTLDLEATKISLEAQLQVGSISGLRFSSPVLPVRLRLAGNERVLRQGAG